MHKLTMPTILIATVMIAGIFAFMPIEKATTVHTTIQGTQLNEVAIVFIDDTLVGNATAGCGTGASGIAYWTVSNTTLNDAGNLALSSVFTIDSDGVTSDINGLQIELTANHTSASGVTAFTGSTARDVIIGFEATALQNIGDISLSVLCRSTDTASATSTPP